MRPRGEARRRAILEAALRLLGREGGGAVTHRSVANEAGVPLAATTYYFESKDALLREAFALCMTEDVAALAAEPFLVPGSPVTVDAVAERVTTLMASRLGDDRHTMLIQYELGLEAARHPELQPMARAWTAAYAGAAAPALAALGSSDPETDAGHTSRPSMNAFGLASARASSASASPAGSDAGGNIGAWSTRRASSARRASDVPMRAIFAERYQGGSAHVR